jgi:hypothetical protein
VLLCEDCHATEPTDALRVRLRDFIRQVRVGWTPRRPPELGGLTVTEYLDRREVEAAWLAEQLAREAAAQADG